MADETGGPAFPHHPLQHTPGMTLRDYFAGQALVGLTVNELSFDWDPAGIGQRAYAIADAMLQARSRDGEG